MTATTATAARRYGPLALINLATLLSATGNGITIG